MRLLPDLVLVVVTDVWVHGQPVVRGRRLATLDQDTLMGRVRALTHDWRVA